MTPNCQSRHVLILIVLSRWTQVKGKITKKLTLPRRIAIQINQATRDEIFQQMKKENCFGGSRNK